MLHACIVHTCAHKKYHIRFHQDKRLFSEGIPIYLEIKPLDASPGIKHFVMHAFS